MRKLLLAAILLFPQISIAAPDDYLAPYFAKAEVAKVGEGEFHKLFWHVYDARLYAPEGKFEWEKPFALELSYKLEISGKDIAERSIEEMNAIKKIPSAKANQWQADMEKIFPDVNDKTTLTGVNVPGSGITFLKNGKKIGTFHDEEFARRFFEIWLSPKTSDKNLRKKLLALNE